MDFRPVHKEFLEALRSIIEYVKAHESTTEVSRWEKELVLHQSYDPGSMTEDQKVQLGNALLAVIGMLLNYGVRAERKRLFAAERTLCVRWMALSDLVNHPRRDYPKRAAIEKLLTKLNAILLQQEKAGKPLH
jgi:hypothetical protein